MESPQHDRTRSPERDLDLAHPLSFAVQGPATEEGESRAGEKLTMEAHANRQPESPQQQAVVGGRAGTDGDVVAQRENASPVCYASQFSDYTFVGAH
jgi:hypothetical protein